MAGALQAGGTLLVCDCDEYEPGWFFSFMADVWSCQSNVTQHQIHLNTWQQHHTQLASVSPGEISFSSWIKSIWNITNFFTRSAPPSSKSILEITQFYIQSLKEQMLKWSRKNTFHFQQLLFFFGFLFVF